MGYESKLFVVKTGYEDICGVEDIDGQKAYHASIIAEYDVSGTDGAFLEQVYTWEDTKYYIGDYKYKWGDGVYERIDTVKDKYGKTMKMGTLEQAINALRAGLAESIYRDGFYYRRYAPILAMLQQLKVDEDIWGGLMVLHYGY